MWTGNENSKPIWNKFIIRKDIIETMQVVLNFCRTVYNILTFTILVGTRYPLNQQSSHGCHTRSRNSLPLYSRVPYAEQELLTLVVNHRVHVAWSLVFCVFLCRLIFVIFSFGHCIVCPSIYDFRLLLWYLQTFLVFIHTVLIEYYGTGGITLDALFNLFRFDVISTEFQWYWISMISSLNRSVEPLGIVKADYSMSWCFSILIFIVSCVGIKVYKWWWIYCVKGGSISNILLDFPYGMTRQKQNTNFDRQQNDKNQSILILDLEITAVYWDNMSR